LMVSASDSAIVANICIHFGIKLWIIGPWSRNYHRKLAGLFTRVRISAWVVVGTRVGKRIGEKFWVTVSIRQISTVLP